MDAVAAGAFQIPQSISWSGFPQWMLEGGFVSVSVYVCVFGGGGVGGWG